MAFEYPDLMNDITDARKRFESGVVQYLAEFDPHPVSAGDCAQLQVTLQNVLEVPIRVAIHTDLPRPRGKLKRLPQPLFRLFEPEIRLTLEGGEVAQLAVPIQVQRHVPPGEYTVNVQVASEPTQEAMRVRPERGENRVGDLKIRYPQGLGIAQIASWGYETKKQREQAAAFAVAEPGQEVESPDLKPQFHSLWTPKDWDLIVRARQEVNERRIHIVPELTAEALYVPFMQESQTVFLNSGIRLHVGEAIFVSKILAHTVTYLMGSVEWQDCLLVPIYAYAYAKEQPTDNSIWLVTQLGYTHAVELAVALSFALVDEILQREVWDRTVQLAVRDFIVECLATGAALPGEFLYLPLLLGGIAVSREVVFDGEDVQASLRLLARAKAEKAEVFADPELGELNDAFDRLVARRARG